MQLRDLIETIGQSYDRSQGMSSPAQRLLRSAQTELLQWVPAGYRPEGSGGRGAAAFVPWIAVFDPDETDGARHGMYVVYLFAEDMQTVALSLNQGVTELVERFKTSEGRQRLKSQADAIRAALPASMSSGLDPDIDLKSRAALPIHYEYGNILATTYKISTLPDESTMVADLRRFVRLYQEALSVRETIRQTTPDKIITTIKQPASPPKNKPADFKPKSDADYVTNVAAHTQVKSRKHETVVRDYGNFLREKRGLQPNTQVHPRDMTVLVGATEWLIEVKMVRRGNAVAAVREALGQLLFYRHFLYPNGHHHVSMVAVFNEDIGQACVDFLENQSVASIWRNGSNWTGSPSAIAANLC
ncbi:MrcB family domain-containing protein [Actinomadura nitritigenes]|uniref:MrcB family domain-containing protein n=1 Tax=Actinomadura nitritigenes TaxID=134602 RepID=UPI003D8B9469